MDDGPTPTRRARIGTMTGQGRRGDAARTCGIAVALLALCGGVQAEPALRAALPDTGHERSFPAIRAAAPLRGMADEAAPASGSDIRATLDADGASAPDAGIRAALDRSFSLAAARERALAADHEAEAARGAMLPRLSLLAALETNDDLLDWSADPEARLGVRVAMPLFASGANVARLRAARAARDAADYGVLARERAVALETLTARLEVALLRRTVRALEGNARGMAEILATTETLRRAGEAGRADVAFARSNLDAARGEIAAARTSLADARLDYRTLTGGEAGDVGEGAFDHLVPADGEALVAEAVRRSPEVLQGFRDADARRHASRAAWGDLGPRVDLTASASHDYDLGRGYDAEDWRAGVGIQLSMPVLDLESRGRARASASMAREAEWRARDLARTAERRARAALIAHRGAGERATAARRRIDALEGALAATRAEYRIGLRPVTDVTRVQLDLARARIELAEIERDRARAAVTIGLLAGRPIDGGGLPALALGGS